jgi:magnesium transporter
MPAAEPVADKAIQHISRAVPAFPQSTPLGEIRRRMAAARYDDWDWIYGLDGDGRLAGRASIGSLLGEGPERSLSAVLEPVGVTAGPDDDQEHVAHAALAGRIPVVPVVADSGQFLGVVPPAALIEVLAHEHTEDLHRLAGIQRRAAPVDAALEESSLRRLLHRLPWLIVGLAGALGSALIVADFEEVLRHSVALAFFVPAVVYLADAVGTQTEALTVRGLALGDRPLGHLFLLETATGCMIGLVLGGLALPVVWLLFGQWELAVTVAGGIVVASTAAASIGLLLPCLIGRFGFDPAFGSGPLATVIQDLLTLIIYFALGSALL